jgi:hypothetical protein
VDWSCGGSDAGIALATLPDWSVWLLLLGSAAWMAARFYYVLRKKMRRRSIKALLGQLVGEGDALLGRINEADPQAFKVATDLWASKGHEIIKAAFGDTQAALFLSDIGYSFRADPDRPNWECQKLIKGRLRRLADLIRTTDNLPIETDFDPRTWTSAENTKPHWDTVIGP